MKITKVIAFFLCVLALSCAREEPQVYRVGVICGFAPFSDLTAGFMDEMSLIDFGPDTSLEYFIYHIHDGNIDESKAFAELIEHEVDLVYAYPTGTVINARAALGDEMPILFGLAVVEGTNLVDTHQHPGRNITGIRVPGIAAVLKRFEYLVEIIPVRPRILAAYNRSYIPNQVVLLELREMARESGFEIVEVAVNSVQEMEQALLALGERPNIDGIGILSDNLSQSPEGWAILSSWALKHGVPISGGSLDQIHRGAVISYAPNFYQTGRLAAAMAEKILKGSNPGTVPLQTAAVSLVINKQLANEFNLEIPEFMLNLATEIIR